MPPSLLLAAWQPIENILLFENTRAFQTVHFSFQVSFYGIGYQPCPAKPWNRFFVHGYFFTLKFLWQPTSLLNTKSNFGNRSFNFKGVSCPLKENMILLSNFIFCNQFPCSSIWASPFTICNGKRFSVSSYDILTFVVPYCFTNSSVYVLTFTKHSFKSYGWPNSLNLLKLVIEHKLQLSKKVPMEVLFINASTNSSTGSIFPSPPLSLHNSRPCYSLFF